MAGLSHGPVTLLCQLLFRGCQQGGTLRTLTQHSQGYLRDTVTSCRGGPCLSCQPGIHGSHACLLGTTISPCALPGENLTLFLFHAWGLGWGGRRLWMSTRVCLGQRAASGVLLTFHSVSCSLYPPGWLPHDLPGSLLSLPPTSV